ncbi:hypothetical protein [Aeromonas hydrophila]
MPDLTFLEMGHKDAAQLIDLTNYLCKHCLDALISKMMDRGDTPDLVSFARPPNAGVECANGVFDRLLKGRQGAFLLKRCPKCIFRPIMNTDSGST